MALTHTVLWIDDESNEEFKNLAYDGYGLEIIDKTCYNDGIAWLKENLGICDAVILDVNCKSSDDPTEVESMESFTSNLQQVTSLCKEGGFIPWLVYSGGSYEGKGALNYVIKTEKVRYGRKEYYDKPSDRHILFEDVVFNIENRVSTAIRHKYSEAFTLEAAHTNLVKILSTLEEGDTRNTGVFNIIRDVMGNIMDRCYNLGLCAVKFTGTNLSECSRFLGKTEMGELIPCYIQRSIHSVCDVSNNGSHGPSENAENLVVKEDVGKGKAPYLIRSTVYELLNILVWLNSVPSDDASIMERSLFTEGLLGSQPIEGFIGTVEQDENGNYHCGEYLLNSRFTPPVGEPVKLSNTRSNKSDSKHKYPFFAGKWEKTIIE